jgi:hypothetical protein
VKTKKPTRFESALLLDSLLLFPLGLLILDLAGRRIVLRVLLAFLHEDDRAARLVVRHHAREPFLCLEVRFVHDTHSLLAHGLNRRERLVVGGPLLIVVLHEGRALGVVDTLDDNA